MDWPCQYFIKSRPGQSTYPMYIKKMKKMYEPTSLRAIKCVHPASGVKWSRNIVVKLFGAFC